MNRKQLRIEQSTNIGLLTASRKMNAPKMLADAETSSNIVVFVNRAGLGTLCCNRIIKMEGLRHV